MKVIWETVVVAFSMFTALPMPRVTWNSQNLRYVFCAFPLIGGVMGLLWAAWAWVSQTLGLEALLRAAGFCLLPVLLTGGIHLDGYADTCDALASYGAPAKRQEILKDPHCGAFAVIRLCAYLIGYFALCGSLVPTDRAIVCMGAGFMLSRVLSGFAIVTFPLAAHTGLARQFGESANPKRVRALLIVYAIALLAGLTLIGRLVGMGMAAVAFFLLWRYRRVAVEQFGGISGDLAGWFVQRTELWMLAALVAGQIGGAI